MPILKIDDVGTAGIITDVSPRDVLDTHISRTREEEFVEHYPWLANDEHENVT